jgi:hypothetical protein
MGSLSSILSLSRLPPPLVRMKSNEMIIISAMTATTAPIASGDQNPLLWTGATVGANV